MLYNHSSRFQYIIRQTGNENQKTYLPNGFILMYQLILLRWLHRVLAQRWRAQRNVFPENFFVFSLEGH